MLCSQLLVFFHAGYLLLLIYSAVNLCDRSWGTREQGSGEDEGLWGWRVYFFKAWDVVTSSWYCVRCCFKREGESLKAKDGRPKLEEESVAVKIEEAKEEGGGRSEGVEKGAGGVEGKSVASEGEPVEEVDAGTTESREDDNIIE